jgi:hypothetical protein
MLGVALEMAEVTEQSDVFLSMVQDIATELDLHLVITILFIHFIEFEKLNRFYLLISYVKVNVCSVVMSQNISECRTVDGCRPWITFPRRIAQRGYIQ